MSETRRVGAEKSKTRARLLDVAERLMLQDGYGSITSRGIAIEADVTSPLVHYYFPSLDDLFIALLRRRADGELERQAAALDSSDPIRALWRYSSDPAAVSFTLEMMALSNQRKALRAELAGYVRRFHDVQVEALRAAVKDGRLDVDEASLPGLVATLTNAARGIAMERGLGTGADTEVDAFIEDTLVRLGRHGSARS